MKAWLRIGALLSVLLVGSSAFAQDAADPNPAHRLQNWLDSSPRWQARFEQVLVDANQRVVERSSGDVYISRPGRFRWDYLEPYPQQIIADGVTLWVYDIDLQQVTARGLDSALSATPAALLGESFVLEQRFNLNSISEGDDLYWLELTPKGEDSGYERIRVGFSGERLARMRLEDSLGSATELFFSEEKRHPEFATDLFQFTPPPEADVIRADESP